MILQKPGLRLSFWKELGGPLGLALVFATAVLVLQRARNDLAVSGDDASYLHYGRGLLAYGLEGVPWAWSPVFVMMNAACVAIVEPMGWHPVDVITVLLTFASILSLWWAMAPWFHGKRIGLLMIWWIIIWQYHMFSLNVFLWGMVLWTISCGLFVRARYTMSACFMMLGSVERSETWLWLVGVAVALWCGIGKGVPLRIRIKFAVAAVGVGLLVGLDDARHERAWFAYGQHYSLEVAMRGGQNESRGDPWRNWEAIVRREFPTATSIFWCIC